MSRHLLSWKLRERPSTYRMLAAARPGNYSLVDRRIEMVMDGFPRSGNTYATMAFMRANPLARVLHHSHAAGAIHAAVQRNLPVVVLVRDPRDCVSSFCEYDKSLSAEEGLELWISFHDSLRTVRDDIAVLAFPDFTGDPSVLGTASNGRFGTQWNEPLTSDAEREEIFRLIEARNTRRNAGLDEAQVARPSAERKAERRFSPDHVAGMSEFSRAAQLYEDLTTDS